MRIRVTEPGQKPYECTMPAEGIGFLIRNDFLVVPIDKDAGEYAKYRQVIAGFTRDSAPSHDSLYNGRLDHYSPREGVA